MDRKNILRAGKRKKASCKRAFWFLFLLAAFLMAANLCAGSIRVPAEEWIMIFKGKGNPVYRDIVMEIRFPRAMAAAVLGGGLALSGYLLQAFFNNPIAGPFILGISSGAKLMVALVMILSFGQAVQPGFAGMIGAAFAGAMISMGFVIVISKAIDKMPMLIVSGIMIGYICSAITDFLVTFAEDTDIVNLHNWSKGSFSGIGWEHVLAAGAVVFPVALGVFFLSKPISAYELGEAYAQNLGLDLKRFRIRLVVLSSLLAACVTAFAGPVSFVGIAVPHLVRYLLGTSRPVLMIPACFLGGAVFCLFCDFLARILLAPAELSISTVTAIFGAPVVLYILIRRKRGKTG